MSMIRTPLATAFALALALASPALAGGDAAYATNCQACHQPAGAGIKGAFPALAGDPFVRGDPDAVIARVLDGKGGMPAFRASLSDAEVAAAVSYIRSAWTNGAHPVTAAEVAKVRAVSR